MTTPARPTHCSSGAPRILDRLGPDIKQRSNTQWEACCPSHEDNRRSLEIGLGADGRTFLTCHAGCETVDILRVLGLGWSALFPDQSGQSQNLSTASIGGGNRRRRSTATTSPPTKSDKSGKPKVEAIYPYRGQDGAVRFYVYRFIPKNFRQCRPGPHGALIWDVAGVEKCLFQSDLLAHASADPLQADQPIFVVEGEKDALALTSRRLLATTNAGGADDGNGGKWLAAYTQQLAGRNVVIIPDEDNIDPKTGRRPGLIHGLYVAGQVAEVAASVKLLRLPRPESIPAEEKWDISKWMNAAEATQEKFTTALTDTPEFDASSDLARQYREEAWPGNAAFIAGGFSSAAAAGQTRGGTNVSNGPDCTGSIVNEADDDPHRLARVCLDRFAVIAGQPATTRTVRYYAEDWHVWQGTAYEIWKSDEFRATTTATIKVEFDRLNAAAIKAYIPDPEKPSLPPRVNKVSSALVTNVLQAMAGYCSVINADSGLSSEQFRNPPFWLGRASAAKESGNEFPSRLDSFAVQNGILNIEQYLKNMDDEATSPKPSPLRPHTPDWFSTLSLPFDFDPAATCPLWERFIATTMERDMDRVAIIQEWFGYLLLPGMGQQKFLLMDGVGSNGKSVVCAAITALIGEKNCSNVPLENFGDRFSLYQTLGKLANVVAEIGELDKVSEGVLKAYTSGDRMMFDRKNKSPIETYPTARLMLATNNRPRITDRSDGVWRRMILLPFRVVVTDREKILGMDKPDWWRGNGQLPGLLNWSMIGLRRLRLNGHFTTSAVSSAAIASYRVESNPANRFLIDNYREVEHGTTTVDDVYNAYAAWCKSSGHRPLASEQLGREVARAFPAAIRSRRRYLGFRQYVYDGLVEGGADADGDMPTEDELGHPF